MFFKKVNYAGKIRAEVAIQTESLEKDLKAERSLACEYERKYKAATEATSDAEKQIKELAEKIIELGLPAKEKEAEKLTKNLLKEPLDRVEIGTTDGHKHIFEGHRLYASERGGNYEGDKGTVVVMHTSRYYCSAHWRGSDVEVKAAEEQMATFERDSVMYRKNLKSK